jgi:large subunit ribosomal protein L35
LFIFAADELILDVPDELNQTYQTYVHWLKYDPQFSFLLYTLMNRDRPNIPLSALSSSWIPDLDTHTPYVPPHPQRGTTYHRYTTLLLPQQSPTDEISVPILSEEDRYGFNVREFMQQYGLDGSRGGGAHMFREVWDPVVSRIYRDVLGTFMHVIQSIMLSGLSFDGFTGVDEPKFGRPREENPFAGRGKRYVL